MLRKTLFLAAVASATGFVISGNGVASTLRVRTSSSLMSAPSRLATAKPARASELRMADAKSGSDSKFAKLLADCKDWGLCRFITINAAGAVLETASPMDVGLNFFEVPGKGQYATLARYASACRSGQGTSCKLAF